jgi:hypothetical protein
MNLYQFFLKKLDDLEKRNIYKIYFIYIIFIILSSLLFCFLFLKSYPYNLINKDFDIAIDEIPFSLGNLISNLVYNNQYKQNLYGIEFYLAKQPALPILLSILFKISKNFFFLVISKNIIMFTIYFFLSYISLLKNRNKIFFFILVLTIPALVPYNFFVALNFVYEDNLIAIFLPLLFILLFSQHNYKFLYIGLILFILFFTKSSLFFLVTSLPIIFFFYKEKKKKLLYFPLLIVILANIIWGSFGFYKTGRFPFANTISSLNTDAFSLVLNKDFKNYYPNLSVDFLHKEPSRKINSEWEFYDYYNNENKNYLANNSYQYLKDILIKLKFIFFGIKADGRTDISNKDNPVRISYILSKFLFNLSILISFLFLFKNYKKLSSCKLEIYFLSISVLSLAPHIIAWATAKHLVPIHNVSFLYLIFYLKRKFIKIN